MITEGFKAKYRGNDFPTFNGKKNDRRSQDSIMGPRLASSARLTLEARVMRLNKFVLLLYELWKHL